MTGSVVGCVWHNVANVSPSSSILRNAKQLHKTLSCLYLKIVHPIYARYSPCSCSFNPSLDNSFWNVSYHKMWPYHNSFLLFTVNNIDSYHLVACSIFSLMYSSVLCTVYFLLSSFQKNTLFQIFINATQWYVRVQDSHTCDTVVGCTTAPRYTEELPAT